MRTLECFANSEWCRVVLVILKACSGLFFILFLPFDMCLGTSTLEMASLQTCVLLERVTRQRLPCDSESDLHMMIRMLVLNVQCCGHPELPRMVMCKSQTPQTHLVVMHDHESN